MITSDPPSPLVHLSETVLLAPGPVSSISRNHVDYICGIARTTARKRARINLHAGPSDPLHEMIVAVAADSYIRPHRHPGKSESFHMIIGEADIVVFDDRGDIDACIRLSATDESAPFCYRMSQPFFHTVVVRSSVIAFLEVTNGPFVAGGAEMATFAPAEQDIRAGTIFLDQLRERIR